MKGQAKIVDVITVLGLIVTFLILLTQIPKIYKDVFDMLALASAEVVSREVASLISISAAAPYKITLVYNVSYTQKGTNYTIELKNREANVTLIKNGEAKETAIAPFAVNNLNKKIENQNCFVITKDPSYVFDFGVCP